MRVLIFCGSPRKGNSESLSKNMKDLLDEKGVKTEVIILRKKDIRRCNGCVEYCNKNLKCCQDDDMGQIMEMMKKSDGYVFVVPTYFSMPPGIFKDFIDKCSILFTSGYDLSSKKSVIVSVGTEINNVDENIRNISENFCKALGINVIAKKGFISKSELNDNYDDIFENGINPGIEDELEKLSSKIYRSLKYESGELITC